MEQMEPHHIRGLLLSVLINIFIILLSLSIVVNSNLIQKYLLKNIFHLLYLVSCTYTQCKKEKKEKNYKIKS